MALVQVLELDCTEDYIVFTVVGPHLNSLLRTSSHLRRLSMALVQVLELDCTEDYIVFTVVGPHLNSLLRTSSHLRRLSMALVQVLELDCTDLKIIFIYCCSSPPEQSPEDQFPPQTSVHGSSPGPRVGLYCGITPVFTVVGPHLNSLLRTSSHLRRLSMALVQVLELDCTDLKIIEERTTTVGHGGLLYL